MEIRLVGADAAVDPATKEPEVEQEYDLLDLLIMLGRSKSLILRLTLAASVIGVIVALIMPAYYTATAKILPPKQPESISQALLGQFAPLAGVAGQDLGVKAPADLYIGMLRSRTIADAVVDHFDLRKTYDVKYTMDARRDLEKATEISTGRDGAITIAVEDRDPKRAAEMANYYVAQLHDLTTRLSHDEAAQRRAFFKQQLQEANEELRQAEQQLKVTQERTGIIQLEGQARVILESAAVARAQVAAKEVQIRAMRAFATAQNPELQRAEEELAGLRAALAQIERSQERTPGTPQFSAGKVPGAALEYLRAFRELQYQEAVFETIAKQYEVAKLDEAKNAPVVQVIDQAVVPEKRSRPRRTIIVLLAALQGLLVGLGVVFGREAWQRIRQSPSRLEKLHRVRTSFRLWRPNILSNDGSQDRE